MASDQKSSPAVVIDNGSLSIKAGFGADREPRVVIPSAVSARGVGADAIGQPDVDYPIVRGRVKNWENMEKLWEATFSALKTTPSQQPILLTEAASVDKADREKMAEIMFEKFNVPSLYLADQSILALYANGLMDGIALSSGHGVTQIVPSVAGNPIRSSTACVDLGGADLTSYLAKLLGGSFGVDKVTEIKENDCFVALDYAKEVATAPDKVYALPDGQKVTVNSELLKCPEAIFQPEVIGQGSVNIPQMICDAAAKAASEKEIDISKLCGNLILAGGNTAFKGLPERMEKEVKALAPAGTKVAIVNNPMASKVNSTFIGGSILVCLGDFQPMWVTKSLYKEKGPAIIHEKCV